MEMGVIDCLDAKYSQVWVSTGPSIRVRRIGESDSQARLYADRWRLTQKKKRAPKGALFFTAIGRNLG